MEVYNIATVVTVTLIGVLIAGILLSYWLASVALFPRFVRETNQHFDRPVKAFLWGLIGVVPFVLGLSLLGAGGLGALVGSLVLAPVLLLGFAGSAGFAQRIGIGLASPADRSQPWKRVLRGGVVLIFLMLFPVIGWTLGVGYVLTSGFGAALQSIRSMRKARREEGELDAELLSSAALEASEIANEKAEVAK